MPDAISLDELRTWEARELTPSDWFEINQHRINQFAKCTDDSQFVHVDTERMKDTEFGGTIAHGFLSLSLVSGHEPVDWPEIEGQTMTLNYGLDKVRFIKPVKVDSRLRFHTKILSVVEKAPGRILIKALKTLEIEGEDKPAMIAETLIMIVIDA